MNVWGSSEDSVLTVGGAPDRGRMFRYDGAEWREETLGVEVPLLNWIHGFGPNDVTVVGNAGTILHFDGAGWSPQGSGTTEDLWGVWGAAPNDLWAVGGSGFVEATATILHYDGSAWTIVELPALTREVHGLFKVWGTSSDNVYVVGQRGTVLHWQGSAWTEELVGASDDLVSIWGTGPDRVVAIGGRGNGIVSRWDGTEWRTEFLTPLPGLNGIWMRDASTAHVAGTRGTLGVLDVDSLTVTESPVPVTRDFHACFGVGGRLFAVGGNLATGIAGPHEGVAYARGLEDGE